MAFDNAFEGGFKKDQDGQNDYAQQNSCDSLEIVKEANKELLSLYDQGFLLAGYKLLPKDSCFEIFWENGKSYKWRSLHVGNLPELLLAKSGFRQFFFKQKTFELSRVKKLFNRIITESENSGFPFASIKFDSVSIENEFVSASLDYEPGPYISFDKLIINGTSKVKPEWLAAHLNLREGTEFNQAAINDIRSKIGQMPFIELINEPAVIFKYQQAEVTLELKDRSSNLVDGIIGFLPNEEQDGRLLITGQVNLQLQNLFSSGKALSFNWQSIKPRSQYLDINYRHPNIFRSDFGALINFNLLKEDTFFINRNSKVEAIYEKGSNTISLLYRSNSSSNLSVEDVEEVGDFTLNSVGIRWQLSNYKQGNINGRSIEVMSVIGTKQLASNTILTPDIEKNSTQTEVLINFQNKIRVKDRLGIFNQAIGQKLWNDNLFRNDMFRLGGLNSLRGFNDNFFFASEFMIIKSEIQYYFQQQSYLFLFYDQLLYTYESVSQNFEDSPFGFGAGLALETNSGILNLVYALGNSKDQPLDTRLSKFHFGYILRF